MLFLYAPVSARPISWGSRSLFACNGGKVSRLSVSRQRKKREKKQEKGVRSISSKALHAFRSVPFGERAALSAASFCYMTGSDRPPAGFQFRSALKLREDWLCTNHLLKKQTNWQGGKTASCIEFEYLLTQNLGSFSTSLFFPCRNVHRAAHDYLWGYGRSCLSCHEHGGLPARQGVGRRHGKSASSSSLFGDSQTELYVRERR